jgi:hypothetical protein
MMKTLSDFEISGEMQCDTGSNKILITHTIVTIIFFTLVEKVLQGNKRNTNLVFLFC